MIVRILVIQIVAPPTAIEVALALGRGRDLPLVEPPQIGHRDIKLDKTPLTMINLRAQTISADTELFMVQQGRMAGRMVAMWKPFRGILEVGVQHWGRSEAEIEELPESVQDVYNQYTAIVNIIPSIPDVIMDQGPTSISLIARSLDSGRRSTRASDINSIKSHINQWRAWNPSFKTTMPHTLGFNNLSTGALLCPANLDWTDPAVQKGLRDGTIRAGPRDLPKYLWKNEYCDPDPSRALVGFLQGDLLIRGIRHLLIAPSAAHLAGSSHSTRKGNAAIHDVTFISIWLVAYTACIIHFVLSTQTIMAAGNSRADPTKWRYEEFYKTIIKTAMALPQSSLERLLVWWSKTIFGAGYDNGDDDDDKRRQSNRSIPSIASIVQAAASTGDLGI
ncbi:hypothetical protein NP233_g94 [Leucocoprinus birnbaumii]|uniref:Uncharacterized protein n=1 Tax=Leucocoprinus birnbaumii TaxID=56174 RepID=A0AAD5W2U0_9AGAR|nr:hypothetical protein NP233_g94 [Leucocoprinus birnbaumii]